MFTANAMPAFTKVGLGRGRKWYMIYFKDHFPSRKLAVILRLLLEGSKVSLETKVLTLNKREERERKRGRLHSLSDPFSLYCFSIWSSCPPGQALLW